MASIEFITKRIEGKKAEIKKLQAKADRIAQAAATNWTVNPYCYHESDAKWTAKHLAEAEKQLADYEAKLAVEQEKENSRNVKEIIDFLEEWKKAVKAYYLKKCEEFPQAHAEHRAIIEKINDEKSNYRYYSDEYKALRKQEEAENKEFSKNYGDCYQYVDMHHNYDPETGKYTYTYRTEEDLIDKDLKRDAELKYDEIIARTQDIVGQITDASNLSVGLKGDLNGIVIGTKGKAKVNTIGAGGYNIVCYHFRTLIKAIH